MPADGTSTMERSSTQRRAVYANSSGFRSMNRYDDMNRPCAVLALGLCLALAILAFWVWEACAQTQGTVFRGVPLTQVFAADVQVDDGRDWHQYAYVAAVGSVCDVSRPDGQRVCDIDLVALLTPFAFPVLEYVRALPASVNWTAWDWQTMTTNPGGYTPVDVVVQMYYYDAVHDNGRQHYVACSRIPATPDTAVCYVRDRLDHYNYVLVVWADVARALDLGE